MKLRVKSDEYNPLLRRREVLFEVDHGEEGGTPRRVEVRRALAEELKADLECVYVRRIETLTGTTIAVGEAHVYDTPEQARFVEPEFIKRRNQASESEGEGE